jgi:mono/diheme cytochrome c family protein
MRVSRKIVLVVGFLMLVLGAMAGGRYLIRERVDQQRPVIVPNLSAEGAMGEAVFAANCASCHGKNAAGTDKGPPLINPIYSPSHHSDFSFARAVTLGVPPHHWLFGEMPAQPQVTRKQIDEIVAYVRELQRANGIR